MIDFPRFVVRETSSVISCLLSCTPNLSGKVSALTRANLLPRGARETNLVGRLVGDLRPSQHY